MDNTAPPTTPDKALRWPYISWKTLLNLIQKFEADGGALPPRIDRSVLGGSEGQKTQLMATLKFLGLMGEQGEAKPLFQQLVSADDNARKPIVRDMLQRLYPEATKLGKEHATTKQLEESFTGLSGDTLRKAMTFYIHAAKYSNHPLSKFFKTPSGFRPAGAPRRAKPSNGGQQTPTTPADGETPATSPSDAKARYIDMLLEKANKDGDLNTELLDRIEKLLGFETKD